MPRTPRHISSLLDAPIWAINMERGQRVFTHMAMEARDRSNGLVLSRLSDTADANGDREAGWWEDMLKSTGQFPYYVNPDGTVVHSVEKDAMSKVLAGAVAVVPVHGTLVHDCWAIEEVCYGIVSSKRVASFLRDVLLETKLVGAVLDIYSPGGMVNGTEALGRAARALSAAKQTVAHVDSLAASAGYWLASQCSRIILDGETSEVGSVGVMLSFFDIIPFYEAMGVRYHELYPEESSKKNEGWRQLSTQKDPAIIKSELAQTALVFRRVVQEGRGARLGSDAAVLEGRVYAGTEAVSAGLADGLGDLRSCIQSVRPATDASGAPASTDPRKPDPVDAPAETDATNSNPTTSANTNRPMNLKSVLASFAALFGAKEDATAENIAAANAELKEKGISNVHLVDSEAFNAAQNAEARVSAAEAAATTAQAEREAAVLAQGTAEAQVTGLSTGITEAATTLGVAAEGTALEVLGAIATTAKANATDLATRTAELATAQARITELEGRAASDGKPAGATNNEGDVAQGKTIVSEEMAEFAADVKAQAARL